eukprot:8188317-Karenia_brevis.AAC.2
MIISPDPIYAKKSSARIKVCEKPNCVPDTIRARSGRQRKLKRRACTLHLRRELARQCPCN